MTSWNDSLLDEINIQNVAFPKLKPAVFLEVLNILISLFQL